MPSCILFPPSRSLLRSAMLESRRPSRASSLGAQAPPFASDSDAACGMVVWTSQSSTSVTVCSVLRNASQSISKHSGPRGPSGGMLSPRWAVRRWFAWLFLRVPESCDSWLLRGCGKSMEGPPCHSDEEHPFPGTARRGQLLPHQPP